MTLWHMTSWHITSWHITSWPRMPCHMTSTSWHMMCHNIIYNPPVLILMLLKLTHNEIKQNESLESPSTSTLTQDPQLLFENRPSFCMLQQMVQTLLVSWWSWYYSIWNSCLPKNAMLKCICIWTNSCQI